MTSFLSNLIHITRNADSFSSSCRNAGYDNRYNQVRIVRAQNSAYRTNGDAADQKTTAYSIHPDLAGGRSGGYRLVSPSSFLRTLARFLWSVIMRIFRRFQPVSIILFAFLFAFLAGFVVFGEKVTSMTPPVMQDKADAIIVLTGGQSRLEVAIDLLKAKHGKRLLISGVHPSTNEKMLQQATHTEAGLFDCCVDLDRSALNTAGNAEESERWIRSKAYRRVIIVTNNYHIPRSILEMSSRMKDVEFVPYPVVNSERGEQSWVSESDTLRVLLVEYVKYLGAMVRVSMSELMGRDIRK